MLQAGASLVAVLALVLLAGRAMRLRGHAPGADPHALRLTASVALDSRRRLHMVQAPGGALLVLTGGANDQMLAWPTARDGPPGP
jgi:hypothetical protein